MNVKVRAILVVVGTLAAMAGTIVPAEAVTPVGVVVGPTSDSGPAASTSFVAWTRTSFDPKYRSNVYAEAIGGSPFRVNAKGTEAYLGAIDGSTLFYIEDNAIKLLDLSTMTDLPVPAGMKPGEFILDLSGTDLLLGRYSNHSRVFSIRLLDTPSGTAVKVYTRTVAEGRWTSIQGAQLNGNFATWGGWVFSAGFRVLGCDVWTYDIAAATATKLPNPDGKCQSGPAVSSDGTVYFDRAGLQCGQHARMIALPPGGTESVVYRLPKGNDYASAQAVDNADGTVDVYFDPLDCYGTDGDGGDIVKLPGVQPL